MTGGRVVVQLMEGVFHVRPASVYSLAYSVGVALTLENNRIIDDLVCIGLKR